MFKAQSHLHTTQDNLEPRAKRCVFLGYPEGVKGLKLWNFEHQKNIISKDVFDEETMYRDLNKQGERRKGVNSKAFERLEFKVELRRETKN